MAILELQNVSKIYQMGKITVNAVQEASFSINAGEFASVSGPSGSGKSTLLNLMGLIDLPSGGKIIVDGIDVYNGRNLASLKSIPASLDRHMTELRRLNLGFIFQNFNLIQVLNVRENVELPLKLGRLPQNRAMGAKEAAEWVDYLIETVGLTDWKNHKPTELSGGQRQRVAIARALSTKAPVIMADEPTANLDSKNGDQILQLMKKLNKELNTTFVFSTHDQKIVSMSDHVIHIKDGIVTGQDYANN
ncbi:MAG: ABC transporter ATP-binding protein [Treponema sp.]|nr:ABC transporter ATP-binding protein [Treponema sp.]